MLTRISAALPIGGIPEVFRGASSIPPLAGNFWEGVLAPILVLALVAMAIGFLLLVSRLSWAAREFVVTCRERQRAHRRLVEMLQEHLETNELGLERLWSASTALSAC
jgi:hypothetical protein